MAVTADKVVVELELRDGQYLSRVRANESAFAKAQARTAQSAEAAERRIRASNDKISSSFRAMAGSIAAGFSVAAVKNLADSYTQMQNRLRVTGLEAEGLANQYQALNDVANNTRSGIEETVAVYSRLRLATEGMGYTNEQVTRTVEILNKALSAPGASTGEAAAAVLQFSQAIGSGVLQGDELRSLRENAPTIARAIAAEFNTTVGGLKKLGEEGQLTSDRVLKGVMAAGSAIDESFGRTQATVSNALTNIRNEFISYIGRANEASGATDKVISAINGIADNLDRVIPAIATIVALIGARYVAAGLASVASSAAQAIAHQKAGGAAIQQALAIDGLIATQARFMTQGQIMAAQVGLQAGRMSTATAATRAFGSGLLALAGGPVGAAVLAVAALAAGVIYLNSQYSDTAVAARELKTATEQGSKALDEYEKAQIKARDASKESAAYARDNAKAMREEAQAAIVAARALAAKRTQEAQTRLATATAAVGEATRGRPGLSEAEAIGQASFAAGAVSAAQRAQEAAAAAIREQIRQEQEFARISAGINLGGVSGGGGGATTESKPGKKSSGPTPEELAASRERIVLEAQLARAQAANNEIEARRIERQIRLIDLTKEYKDAQFADAEALAKQQNDALSALEDQTRELDRMLESDKKRQERRAEAEELIRAERERTLAVELEIARLSLPENDPRVKKLERELELLQRINEYGAGRADQAVDDQTRINQAEDDSEMRTKYEGYARSFIDVLRSDDIWGSLGQKFADGAAENLAKSLGNLLSQLASQNNGSGGFLSSALKFGASLFGGGRALGGPVRAGWTYDVGENGREKFVAPASGYIIPNTETATAKAGGGGGMAFTYAPVYQVSGYGQDIEGLKRQMEADRAGFRNNVAAAVNDGFQRGKIRHGR